MGLKEFFASRRATRSEKQIARSAKKLMNKHVQTGERKRCIDLLEATGSTEAVKALLMRFTFRTDVQIVDEDEKEYAYNALIRLGAGSIPAIEAFVHENLAIYWPLRALTSIAGEDVAVAMLIRELEQVKGDYDVDVARRHELVSNLREFQTDEVFDKLVELLEDTNEEIRTLAIDGLSVFERQEVADHLVPLMLVDDQTARIRQMVLDLITTRGWNVKKYKKGLGEKLPEHFFVDDTGVVRRR